MFHVALQFAKMHVSIPHKDREVVFHSRSHSRTRVLYNKTPWIKKERYGFDVPMGAYDDAEICELIGISRLSSIEKKI